MVAYSDVRAGRTHDNVYLHRTVTHRALVLHPLVEWWFKLANWISTGVDPAVWAAVHRKHHAYADVDLAADRRDPHSPWLEGFWHIQLGNVWWDRHVFRRGWLGLLVGTSILWVILGAESLLSRKPFSAACWDGLYFGSLAAGMHALTFVFFLNPSINALCHWPHKWLGGYQNSRAAHAFQTSNNWIVALLTAGEGFHNNHHDQLATARFGWTRMGIGRGLGLLGRHRAAPLAGARHECASAQTAARIDTECAIRIGLSRRTAGAIP